MSGFSDDLSRMLHDVTRGDLGAAIGDAGRIAHGVSGGIVPSFGAPLQAMPNSGFIQGTGLGGFNSQIPGFHGAAPQPAAPGVMVPPPPVSAWSCDAQMVPAATESRSAPCCDRYSLSGGFLIDGATGTIWKYETKSNSFEEVPVNREKNKQALVDSLLDAKLSALRGEYEKSLMAVANAKERQKLLDAFEKNQLAPLRLATRSLR